MDIIIEKLTAHTRGVYHITVSIGSGESKYEISEGTYREIGSPLSGCYIDEGSLEVIRGEDERRRCLKRALRILEYSDKSKSAL